MPESASDHGWSIASTVMLYAGGAALWILVTDLAAGQWLAGDAEPAARRLPMIGIAKGLLFVAVTSALLYGLLRRFTARMRRREAALSEERTRLRVLVDSIPDPVWLKDADGIYRLSNAASYRAFGFASELEVVGKTDRELLPPAIAARAIEEDRRVLDSGVPLVSEHPRWPRASDLSTHYETIKTPMLDSSGRCVGILSIARDNTAQFEARQRAEERARLEAQLAMVVDSVPGVVCSFRLRADGFGMMPFASKAIYALYGLDRQDLARDASSLNRYVYPDDLAPLRASLLLSARTLTPWRHEWRYQHPQRGLIWLEGNCIPQAESDGSVLWHGFVQDITERKLDEERRALVLGLTAEFLRGGRSKRDLAEILFRRIGAHLGATACFSHRSGGDGELLELVYSEGIPERLGAGTRRLGPDEGLASAVARDGQPIAADREEILANERARTLREMGIGAYACCALLDPQGRVLGTFAVASSARTEFSALELELLQTATQSLALAWQRLAGERQLAASEARLGAVVGSAMDAIISIDEAQRIVLFNRAAEQIFGVSAAEALGTGLDRFLPESARSGHAAKIAGFRRTGVTARRMGSLGRLRGLRSSGEEFPIEASISHAEVRGEWLLTVILRDLSEREEASRALAASQERLVRLASNLPDGAVYEFQERPGEDGSFLYVSAGIERITGLRPEELMRDPHSLSRLVHPEDREHLPAHPQSVEDGGVLDSTVRLQVAPGRLRSMHFRSTPRTLEDGTRLWDGVILDVTDRVQAIDALRDSDRRIVLALEAAGHGVFDWNGATDEVFYSSAWKEILGYGQDEVGSSPADWYERVHPEDLAACMAEIQRHLDGETPTYHAEFRMRTRDGSYKWVLNQGTVVARSDSGVPQRMLGTLTDVSRRHEIEARLRASESALVEAQALALLGSWSLDCASGLFIWSQEMRRLLGCPEDATPTLEALLDAVHPADRAAVATAWQGALGGTPYNLQHRVVIGAETRWIRARGRFVLGEDGRPLTGVGTLLDVTERVRMLESLERHQQHLEELVAERTQQLEKANRNLSAQGQAIADLYNRAPCGYHSLDADGVFVAINDTELEWLGYEREEVLHRMRLTDVLSSASKARYEECFRRLMQDGSINDVDYELVRRDGTLLPVTLSSKSVNGADGRFLWTRSTLFDNTERRRREREIEALNAELARRAHDAEAANRAKTAFLANMSHEIRTPLNAILGFTDLLSRNSRDAGERTRLRQVGEAARHLLSIIDDVLDLSKIEAGKLELETSDFDLEELVRGASVLFAERAEAKGLRLALDIDGGPFLVHGDPMRLRQILMNYLSNAVKFTDQGTVSVRLRGTDERDGAVTIRLEVEDTGIGVAARDQLRLFEPFEQADASTTRRFGGTGLGLAINRRLASLMGGEVGVQSEPGRGSSFWVRVRLERAADSARLAAARTELAGCEILLVAADPADRAAHSAMLASLGVRVAAMTGEEPLEVLAAARRNDQDDSRYAAVLLIARSDGPDVHALARELGALPLAHRLPCLVLPQAGLPDAAGALPMTLRELEQALASIVRVELSPSASSAAMLVLEQRLRAAHRGAHVLIAEDNPLNQQVTCDLLQPVGLTYDVACDGAEAVELARGRHYDLILMDVHMPVLNGLDATAAIRELPGYAHTPIVAMTADGFEEDRARSRGAGMDELLVKPVAAARFYSTMLRWLDRRADSSGAMPDPAPAAALPDALQPIAASSEEAAPLSAAIHRLPGLDAAIGFKFARGRLTVYLELLQMFADPAHLGAGGLTRSAASGDLTELRQRAHALKGVAALIGATRIQGMAIDVEAAVRAGRPAEEIRAAASAVDTEFAHIAAAIRELPSHRPPAAIEPVDPAADPKLAEQLIDRLDKALTDGDFAAYEIVERHGPMLHAVLGSDAAAVERHVAAFAFEAARAALRSARYSSTA